MLLIVLALVAFVYVMAKELPDLISGEVVAALTSGDVGSAIGLVSNYVEPVVNYIG